MKSNLLIRFLSTSIQAGVSALILICISTHAQAGPTLAAVGPAPLGQYDKVSCGYLKVFSRTQEAQWGEGSYYYPHTAYWIYNSAGKQIKTVENHSDNTDEAPEKVELTPGTYFVRAWSDNDGLVTVPVVIKLARTTSVHLENGRDSDKENISSDKAVTTPSKQVVGWKA
ncbi:MAG: T9SS type A sorting domain-containing protein [Methylacidiphilales bacterium]|nr:T9SS type A sorting domain-containing protein [Candidatus Methylacidiphilales bacterium]